MFKRVWVLTIFYLFMVSGLAYAWDIKNYKIDINLQKDSSFIVTETIEADFGDQSKHGIFRDIPTSYQDENGHPYHVRFDLKAVQDQNQKPWQYKQEDKDHFKRIKIGSPSQTVSGKQTYSIIYHVTGAILFFDDHDELYWNAIGTQWDVNIHHVFVSLTLPEPVSKQALKMTTYTGVRGSKTSNARSEIVSNDKIVFEGENYLPQEGFTIVVGLPKGILTQPTAAMNQDEAKSFMGPWWMTLPVLVFIIMLNLWQRFGKDPQFNKTIVVEYKAPDDLKPAEMGTLIDCKVDKRDITSTVIDLAIRGYMNIEQKKGMFFGHDYSFLKLKNFEEDKTLKSYEREILRGIFNGNPNPTMAQLKDNFYQNIDVIEEKIKEGLKPKKYLGTNPSIIIISYTVLGCFIVFISLFAAIYDVWLMAALMLSAVVIFIFGSIMPKRTVEGAKVLSKILGFKEFLQRTEKDKIEKVDQQDVFERMLPYAICLGMSIKWATKFDGLYTQSPQWFTAQHGQLFVYHRFIHDLDASLNQMSSSFYSSPQTLSSGGGFSSGGSSGGGFGGGGGGSW